MLSRARSTSLVLIQRAISSQCSVLKYTHSSPNVYRVERGFSKSGLRSGSGPGGNSIRTRLYLIFQAHSYHSDLRVVCVAHTHTHTHVRMNQCCSDYRLFCKTKQIATSDILDKPLISFSRIMSPVSPCEREVSPSRCSLSPLAELEAHSKNRTEPNRSRLVKERVQNSVFFMKYIFKKNYN